MVRWLHSRVRPNGQWSVRDRIRGYRICAHHPEAHGGTHVHFPEDGPDVGTIDVRSRAEAEAIMLQYGRRHDVFAMDRLQQEVNAWRSASHGK